MKVYEKILIGIFLLLLGIRPFLSDHYIIFAFFFLFISLWAISYLIGGYWLFNPKENKSCLIPIVAGITFATSLFTLPFTMSLYTKDLFFLKILPLLNIVFFIVISIYLISKRKQKTDNSFLKNIFIRSLVIMIITCFFSYTPFSFKPYRYVLIALNYGDKPFVNNMQAFNYMDKFEKAIKSGDCERAIEFAEKANEAGKRWLGISSEEINDSHQNELWKTSGTFSNLYWAYKCKADIYYDKNEYEQALIYYIKADKALNACHHFKCWEEQANSLNKIALCYQKLYNYEYADSLFIKAIEKYKILTGKTDDRNMAILYANLAASRAEQLQFRYSNLLYAGMDSSYNNKKELIDNYYNLLRNHLETDSLDKAMLFIEETFKQIENAVKTVNE